MRDNTAQQTEVQPPVETQAGERPEPMAAERLRLAAQMDKNDKPADKGPATDKTVQPMVLEQQKTNSDGTKVKFDEQGRPTVLLDKNDKLVHELKYKDKDSKEPESIKLADGSEYKQCTFLGKNKDGSTPKGWAVDYPNGKSSAAFLNASVKVHDDGAFTLRYEGGGDKFYKDIKFSASGQDTPRVAHMTRPDGTEQFVDDKGIRHLKKDGKETLVFENGSTAKLVDGKLSELRPRSVDEKRVFSHDADGNISGFKDSDGTVVKRVGTFDKEGYAQWQTSSGDRVSAKVSVDKYGVSIQGKLGHEFDFSPEGKISVVKPVIQEQDGKLAKVTYPDGSSREFSYAKGEDAPNSVTLRNSKGEVQSSWIKTGNETWKNTVSGKVAVSQGDHAGLNGNYAFQDKSGNWHEYKNDGTYNLIKKSDQEKVKPSH